MIELTTSLLMLASAFSPAPVIANAQEAEVPNTQKIIVEEKNHPVTLETYVREYFADTPILAEIARCESTFRQHDSKGDVLLGKVNKGDIGVMQINKYYHAETAEKLGFDIYTLEGNLAYGKWLYGKYGSDPWSSSSKCWKNSEKIAFNK